MGTLQGEQSSAGCSCVSFHLRDSHVYHKLSWSVSRHFTYTDRISGFLLLVI